MKKYAQELGSLGGKARAKKTTKQQRITWGKLGGRPKKVKEIQNVRVLL